MRKHSQLIALAGLAAMSAGISAAVAQDARVLTPTPSSGDYTYAPSGSTRESPNRRPRGAAMAHKRAARKARNVKRHRAACKGRA